MAEIFAERKRDENGHEREPDCDESVCKQPCNDAQALHPAKMQADEGERKEQHQRIVFHIKFCGARLEDVFIKNIGLHDVADEDIGNEDEEESSDDEVGTDDELPSDKIDEDKL